MAGPSHGYAVAADASAEKQAFEAAKELGTVEAWDAFLSSYPSGFYADLARAYVKKLSSEPAAPGPSTAADESAQPSWCNSPRNATGRRYDEQIQFLESFFAN